MLVSLLVLSIILLKVALWPECGATPFTCEWGWTKNIGYSDWFIYFIDVPKCTVKVLRFVYDYGYKEEYVCVCEEIESNGLH